jgi:hypothetical protein
MNDQLAVEIIYNLVVKFMRGPLDDRSLDAIFHVRAMIEAQKGAIPERRIQCEKS